MILFLGTFSTLKFDDVCGKGASVIWAYFTIVILCFFICREVDLGQLNCF